MLNSINLRKSFSQVRVLVVGDVMLDRYWWGDVSRISPEAPVPVVRLRKSSFAPGGAANVAVNIAGLGAQVDLLGCIGSDADGTCLGESLGDLGVSAANLVTRSYSPTNVKTRVIAHNQQVVRVDQEVTSELTAEDETALLDAFNNLTDSADLVVCSDYAKGVLSPSILSQIITLSRSRNKTVVVDPKGRDYSRYRGASILTPNRREAADACGLDDEAADVVQIAGARLVHDLELSAALITQSEDGMTLFQANAAPISYPAHAVEIYDVTGAGDTVVATLATGLASGMSYVDAVEIANAAAGIVVGQVGTTAITIAKLEEALERVPGDSEHAGRGI